MSWMHNMNIYTRNHENKRIINYENIVIMPLYHRYVNNKIFVNVM